MKHISNLWAHTADACDPDDKGQFGICRYVEVAGFLCHPSHLTFGSVHLPVFLMKVLSFFIGKLSLCLLETHLLGELLLLRCWSLSSVKFFCFRLMVSGIARTFFFSFLLCSPWFQLLREGATFLKINAYSHFM